MHLEVTKTLVRGQHLGEVHANVKIQSRHLMVRGAIRSDDSMPNTTESIRKWAVQSTVT